MKKTKNKDKNIKNVYKYIKLEHLISTIENGLYMAPAKDLNDPFEYIALKHSNKFYIGCMTSSFKNKIMWSIYGNSHKGCVIQFQIDNLELKKDCIRRVDYKSELLKNRDTLNKKETYELLFCKDKKWINELEIRSIYDVSNKGLKYKSYWNFIDEKIYLKVCIKRVYLGCASQYDPIYDEIIKYLYDKDIEFKKMKMHYKRYAVIIDKDYY